MNTTTTTCKNTPGSIRPPAPQNPSQAPPTRTTTSKPLSPRTRAEALRDVDYIVRVGVVHQRLFSRLDKGLKLVQVFGGSAAFGAATSGQMALMTVAGVMVALTASVGLVFDFGLAAQRYGVLVSRCNAITLQALSRPEMTIAEIDAAKTRDTDLDLNVIEALRVPCFNEVQRRHGLLANVKPLTLWQRFWTALA